MSELLTNLLKAQTPKAPGGAQPDAHPAPPPKLSQVLYAPPNPDGSTKNCLNCCLFVSAGRCTLHGPQQPIKPTQVCGYHVFGDAQDAPAVLTGILPVTPAQSGLVDAPQGTACQSCTHYSGDPGQGSCAAVVDDSGQPAPVQALGCCTRWEGGAQGSPPAPKAPPAPAQAPSGGAPPPTTGPAGA